jgi:hypothetical protein
MLFILKALKVLKFAYLLSLVAIVAGALFLNDNPFLGAQIGSFIVNLFTASTSLAIYKFAKRRQTKQESQQQYQFGEFEHLLLIGSILIAIVLVGGGTFIGWMVNHPLEGYSVGATLVSFLFTTTSTFGFTYMEEQLKQP